MDTKKMEALWEGARSVLASEAGRLGVPVAAALAVFAVESGGAFFGPGGKPVIRFEVHKFWQEWGSDHAALFDAHFRPRRGWKNHEFREADDGVWESFHGNQAKEYRVFDFAKARAFEAAMRSISMGAPQILGLNHALCGFGTAAEMYAAFCESTEAQIRAFFAFVENSRLVGALRGRDFRAFAAGYNGPANVDVYAAALVGAYGAAVAVVTSDNIVEH